MALGLDNIEKIEKEFKDTDTGEVNYIKETLKRDTCKDQKEALVEIYRRLRPGDLVTPDTAQDLIFNMFFKQLVPTFGNSIPANLNIEVIFHAGYRVFAS